MIGVLNFKAYMVKLVKFVVYIWRKIYIVIFSFNNNYVLKHCILNKIIQIGHNLDWFQRETFLIPHFYDLHFLNLLPGLFI